MNIRLRSLPAVQFSTSSTAVIECKGSHPRHSACNKNKGHTGPFRISGGEGGVIRRHLQVNNPIKGIQGLLGYLIVTNAANSDNVEARLGWLTFLGLINAGLLAYIAYVLT